MRLALFQAVSEALEGSILGGTGLHARRNTAEPEGPPPADAEEAAVRTFVEAQVFLRDLFHTMRQTLRLPGAPRNEGPLGAPQTVLEGPPGAPIDGGGPPGAPVRAPVEDPEASIPFPSFDDLLTLPGGPQGAPQEGAPQNGGPQGGSEGDVGPPVLNSAGALAAAAARLYAFFLVHCFGRGALPEGVRLRISRGLNCPTSASLNIKRKPQDGGLEAEWIIHIHADIQHIPLLCGPLFAYM